MLPLLHAASGPYQFSWHIHPDVVLLCIFVEAAYLYAVTQVRELVSDAGRVRLATLYAQRLGVPVVVLHKRRESGTETEVTHVVGDVAGRPCLIVDDIVSTGGTVAESIRALLAVGARPEIVVAATHGVLLAGARDKLDQAGVREVWVTDTVPVDDKDWARVRVVSIAPVIAGALERFLADGSISDLYR